MSDTAAVAAPWAFEIEGLRFGWPGASRPLIDIVDWRLARGAQVFLRGESGAGKSTLLALLAGVRPASQGRVALLGQDWAGLRPAVCDGRRADHVGIVFQQFNLLGYLPVIDNVLLPCRFSARRAARAVQAAGSAREAAARLLAAMGLDAAWWSRPAGTLSVGQQQRVAAARALIGAPELVLADEPTSALDEARREEFMDLLLAACARDGCALVFVSHDARLAARFTTQASLGDLQNAAVPA